jgi:hypothetical protein
MSRYFRASSCAAGSYREHRHNAAGSYQERWHCVTALIRRPGLLGSDTTEFLPVPYPSNFPTYPPIFRRSPPVHAQSTLSRRRLASLFLPASTSSTLALPATTRGGTRRVRGRVRPLYTRPI